ncbi:MAG: TOTE conflict system archaeo-eukaryotic primase domain-containing protein [Gammaproteobacteria bacterium]
MSTEESREALRAEIARRRGELSALNRQRETARDELGRLEAELAALDGVHSSDQSSEAGPEGASPGTPAEKIALFRSLFRGRDDVYPKLWTNAKSGRTGYAPACANEWVRGVCEKPQVRCVECPNQAFLTVSDRVIADHLQGRHVVGVYPLLVDETCWFVAADFDKVGWMADTSAFREACNSSGVPVSVERSRSGNGAHAWIFFESPVLAVTARRMACFLLTKAMSARFIHQIAG